MNNTTNNSNTEKRYPRYTGNIKIPDANHTIIGKITLWDNIEPTSEKSPLMTGIVEIASGNITTKYNISLWKFVPRK